jgi:HEAT repeat protein
MRSLIHGFIPLSLLMIWHCMGAAPATAGDGPANGAGVSKGQQSRVSDKEIVRLLERMHSTDAKTHYAAAEALYKVDHLPDSLVDEVGRLLVSDHKATVRDAAAHLLAKSSSRKGLDYLRKGIRDSEEYVRITSAYSAGDFGKDGAVALPELLAEFDDSRNEAVTRYDYSILPIKYYLVEAIGRIGPAAKDALPRLVAL